MAWGELRCWGLCLHQEPARARSSQPFPFPNPALAAVMLGHSLREALLQGTFAHRFNDQSSGSALNRLQLLLFSLWGRGQLPFRLLFRLRSECSLFLPAWLCLCPSVLGKPHVLIPGSNSARYSGMDGEAR